LTDAKICQSIDQRYYAHCAHVDDIANARINRKDGSPRANTPQASAQGRATFNTSVAISIEDLLDVVNGTFQSILSDDVLSRFNETRNPDGYYSSKVLYSTRDSAGRDLSPEQQEFFKDSQVRDEQGNLLVVYHGTNAEFTQFRTTAAGQTIKDTIGSHFGTLDAAQDRLKVADSMGERAE
jgi:hypothetical protein